MADSLKGEKCSTTNGGRSFTHGWALNQRLESDQIILTAVLYGWASKGLLLSDFLLPIFSRIALKTICFFCFNRKYPSPRVSGLDQRGRIPVKKSFFSIIKLLLLFEIYIV